MEKKVRAIFLTIFAVAAFIYFLSFIPFLIFLIKAKKLDSATTQLNRDSGIYKLATAFRLRGPGFWKGNWGYKLWWTTALDFTAFTMVALFAVLAVLISQEREPKAQKNMLLLAALLVLFHFAVVIANIAMYTKLFKTTDLLLQRLLMLDTVVEEVSSSDPNIREVLRGSISAASPEKPLSAQDLRGIIIGALNQTSSDPEALAETFTTCSVLWYLHQLPLPDRYTAMDSYLSTGSVKMFFTSQSRPIFSLDKQSYMKDTVHGKKFLLSPKWSIFFNQVENGLQRINAAIPPMNKYDDVLRRYKKYIKTQLILRIFVFAILVALLRTAGLF